MGLSSYSGCWTRAMLLTDGDLCRNPTSRPSTSPMISLSHTRTELCVAAGLGRCCWHGLSDIIWGHQLLIFVSLPQRVSLPHVHHSPHTRTHARTHARARTYTHRPSFFSHLTLPPSLPLSCLPSLPRLQSSRLGVPLRPSPDTRAAAGLRQIRS
jgi:hypothetical protein